LCTVLFSITFTAACRQFYEGQDYHELRPTISISFLNHVRFRGLADYHLCFRLLEQKHQVALTGDLEFHLLELPKFRKTEQEVAPGLEVWLYFLRHAEKIDTEAVPRALQQPMVIRALEELKMLTQSDLERERYEARRKAQLDHNSYLNEARRLGREEGRQEGRQEGWQEGRQEGWQEGRQEGWQEGRQEGWQEGRQQGRTEGEKIGLIGNIHMCEQVLDRPETPADQPYWLALGTNLCRTRFWCT
jgi:predicted transposase/invertase (TIGR01784 family)